MVQLAQDSGWEAEGVDVDAEAIANARRRQLTVHLGQIGAQRFPESSFDLALMNHVIEHVHDPLATMKEVHRILRPGGRLVVTVPNAESWGHLYFGRHWHGLEPPRHLWIFNSRNLNVIAGRAGFRHAKVSSTVRMTPYIFVQSRLMRRVGCVDMPHQSTFAEKLYGRVAALVEIVLRTWRPLSAEELLLELRK
jgi:SAM-dependent methyltransferase